MTVALPGGRLVLLAALWQSTGCLETARPLPNRRTVILSAVGTTLSRPATAAEAPSMFVGRYTDPINHPGGYREIVLLENSIGPFRLARVKGGGGRGEPAYYELPAMVGTNPAVGDFITIDFSPKGGPKDFTGVWEEREGQKGIRFVKDQNFWPQQQE